MDSQWIVIYEDKEYVYEDKYSDEKTAWKYYHEAILQGYKRVRYFENKYPIRT